MQIGDQGGAVALVWIRNQTTDFGFPDSEEELDDGIWFYDDNCPGGAVWILEDGSLVWS